MLPVTRPWSPVNGSRAEGPRSPPFAHSRGVEDYLASVTYPGQGGMLSREDSIDTMDLSDYLHGSHDPPQFQMASNHVSPRSHRPFSPPPPSARSYAAPLARPLPPFFAAQEPKQISRYAGSYMPDDGGDRFSDVSWESMPLSGPFSMSSNARRAPASLASSQTHVGSIPWAVDDPEGSQIPEALKQERMKMLEKELYGDHPLSTNESEPGRAEAFTSRRRIWLVYSLMQGLLALGAGLASIYAALFIHPQPSAPSAGTLPAFVLYGLSCLTVLLLLYLHVFRSCCGSRKEHLQPTPFKPLPQRGQRRRGAGQQYQHPIHVNVVIDPSMFRSPTTPASVMHQERGITGALMDHSSSDDRDSTRSQLKTTMFVDALLGVFWGIEMVLVVLGQRCPPGGYEGWCNAYNSATACVAFFMVISLFLVYSKARYLWVTRSH